MPMESLLERVKALLGVFCLDHRFSISGSDDQTNPFGAWVRLESDEFLVDVIRDRGQHWINVTAKARPRPRARRRGGPLGHLLAYLDGAADPYPISDLETEARLLLERRGEILDTALLNSDGLNRWAVKSVRRRSGQSY